jgi:hypothetical protein
MSNFILVIPHIPKTGGQSLRNHFWKSMTKEEFIYLGSSNSSQIRSESLSVLGSDVQKYSSAARVCLGHAVEKKHIEKAFFKKTIFYATCLRDPVERWISEFNFKIHRNTTNENNILEYFNNFSSIQKNYQVYWMWRHFLSNNEDPENLGIKKIFSLVLSELKNFFLVGYLKNFADYQGKICQLLNIPNCSNRDNQKGIDYPVKDLGSAETRQKIFKETIWDRQLLNELGISINNG